MYVDVCWDYEDFQVYPGVFLCFYGLSGVVRHRKSGEILISVVHSGKLVHYVADIIGIGDWEIGDEEKAIGISTL